MYTAKEIIEIMKFESGLLPARYGLDYELPKPESGEDVATFRVSRDPITGEPKYELVREDYCI